MKIRYRVFSICLILLLSAGLSVVTGQEGGGDIELQCSNAVIDVEPGLSEDGVIVCEISNPNRENKTVEIVISERESDLLNISYPATVYIAAGESVIFEAHVSAPEGTLEQQIMIGIDITDGRGKHVNASVVTIVKQYTNFDFLPEQPSLILSLNETSRLEVEIVNNGNGMQTYDLDYENSESFLIRNELRTIQLDAKNSKISNYSITPNSQDCGGESEYEETLLFTASASVNFEGVENVSIKEIYFPVKVICSISDDSEIDGESLPIDLSLIGGIIGLAMLLYVGRRVLSKQSQSSGDEDDDSEVKEYTITLEVSPDEEVTIPPLGEMLLEKAAPSADGGTTTTTFTHNWRGTDVGADYDTDM